MPPLRLLPMPQRMSKAQEENFWCGRDVEMGEELELGPPPSTVQLEEVGERVPWELALEPAEEGLPWSPLGPGRMEVDGAKQAPEDGAMAEEATDEETNSLLQLS